MQQQLSQKKQPGPNGIKLLKKVKKNLIMRILINTVQIKMQDLLKMINELDIKV